VLSAGLFLAGCMRWEGLPVAPGQVLEQDNGDVRLTRTDGDELVLFEYLVSGDSLFGTETHGYRPRCTLDQLPGCEVRMALSDVQYVDVRRLDKAKTAAIVLAPFVAVAAIVIEKVGCSEDPLAYGDSGC
jgi:hypothetical protein